MRACRIADEAGLTARIEETLAMSEAERARLPRKSGAARARERYDWDAVTTQYENAAE